MIITGDASYWLDLAIQKINEWGWMPFIYVPIIISVAGYIISVAARAASGNKDY